MKRIRIGFIGFGMMGKHMAMNLLKRGNNVVGYNRSKNVLQELKKLGLELAASPKEVAERCEIIILMLPSHKETKEIIFRKDGLAMGLKRGQIVLDMSTSNPAETKKIMLRLRKKGITMLDAPVSRGQTAAIKGTLSIMVGGDKKAFNKCLPVLKAMSNYIVHLGPFGSGMHVKALNNFLFGMNLLATSQGLAIIQKNKINLEKAIGVIAESSGNNEALGSIRRGLGQKHPAIGFYLKYMAKDMRIFSDVVKNQKIEHTLAKPVSDFLDKISKKNQDKDAMYLFEHYVLMNKSR